MRLCRVEWNQTSRPTPSPKVSFLACLRPHAPGHKPTSVTGSFLASLLASYTLGASDGAWRSESGDTTLRTLRQPAIFPRQAPRSAQGHGIFAQSRSEAADHPVFGSRTLRHPSVRLNERPP